jgi:glyoxylase I family protein
LELFWYAKNTCFPDEEQSVGNDLERVGVKHLALKVASLPTAKRLLADHGLSQGTDVVHGRTGIDYFFVQDPDGLWLEIVEDHRELAVIDATDQDRMT